MPRPLEDSAHQSLLQTSEFIAVVVLAAGAAIEYFFGGGWSLPLSPPLRVAIGLGVAGTGLVLIAASKAALGKASQPSEPGRPTTEIVTSGIYRHSRNPTYLGLSLVLLGVGIATNMAAWIVGSFIALLSMHIFLVRPEERYLADRFPEGFRAYRSRVRRWI